MPILQVNLGCSLRHEVSSDCRKRGYVMRHLQLMTKGTIVIAWGVSAIDIAKCSTSSSNCPFYRRFRRWRCVTWRQARRCHGSSRPTPQWNTPPAPPSTTSRLASRILLSSKWQPAFILLSTSHHDAVVLSSRSRIDLKGVAAPMCSMCGSRIGFCKVQRACSI